MKYLSICSGIEAASVAWEGLGWEAAGFSEIEPFPCAVLNHRFPKVTNYGDLTKHENWKIERGTIDVICGGTPCQSFSVAGLRAGMADPRGNLALTFLSLCDRLRPEWIVWENVPGVLSSNGGRDLGAFLGALGQLGYGTAYRILDAQYFGVAQRRRRIFVVANLTDWRRAAAVLFEPESLRGDSAKGGKARKGAPAGARNRVETIGTICADSHPGSYSGQDAYTGRLIPAVLVPPTAPTLDASYFKGPGMRGGQERAFVGVPLVPPAPAPSTYSTPAIGHIVADSIASTLTRNTGAGGETQNPAFVVTPAPVVIDRAAFNQGEGAQYPPRIEASETMSALVARGPHAVAAPAIPINGMTINKELRDKQMTGIGSEGDPMFSIRATGTQHAVAAPAPLAFTQNSREEVRLLGDLSGSLPASSGSHLTTYAAIPLPAPEPFVKAKRAQSVDDDETWEAGRPAPTLSVFDSGDTRATVAIVTPEPIAFHPTQDPISSVGVTHTMGTGTTGGAATIAVAQAYAVRRLTPVECERLQGFPDGWTDIPFRGKPASDGPRYKAIGNSMAVPVMRWIGERIAIVDRATKGEG